MLLGLIIGVVLGYIFKPQLDKYVIKAIRYIKDKSREDRD
jgi:membrane associated rhomboid family serine protease